MVITDANIYTTVWDDVKAAIVAKAPHIVNSTTSATTVAGIEATYNDKKISKPQVVISNVDKSEADWKFGSDEGRKFINITAECYYKNSLGTAQLAEQVEAGVKANDFTGMQLIAVSSDNAFLDPNRSKYQMVGITFTFDRE